MGFLGRIFTRIVFSVTIVALIFFGVLQVATVADTFNSVLLIAAILSANILMENYMSREDDVE